MAKIVFRKEGVNELCALLRSNVSIFSQKVTNERQTPLQELETVPLYNIKLVILDVAFKDGI